MSELKINASPLSEFVCRFSLSEDLLGDMEPIECSSQKEAQGSLLLEKLFELDFVKKISLGSRELKVQSHNSVNWRESGKEVAHVLRECVASGQSLFSPSFQVPQKEEVPEEDLAGNANTLAAIKKVIQEQVNPGLAAHGGSAEVADYKNKILYLDFKGGCQGCSQVSVTVKQGIEQLLKSKFPDLREVRDITDHAAGENPYFK